MRLADVSRINRAAQATQNPNISLPSGSMSQGRHRDEERAAHCGAALSE
jgi:hypothetical protein